MLIATDILDSVQQAKLSDICQSFGIQRLQAFGSLVRGKQSPSSDVDLLYELQSGTRMSLVDQEFLADALSSVFGGRTVDLGQPSTLHWMLRDQILAEARTLYEK